MVRKTLELFCADRKAKGRSLYHKILNLKSQIVLPTELFNGIDELRLLGNDAAHVESKSFNHIGKEEIYVGIQFTIEILKASYQYKQLLEKLQKLKASPKERK